MYYLSLAGAYARGKLHRPGLDDEAAVDAGRAAGLRLHRFKRTGELARVRAVLGVLRELEVQRLLDVGSGRGTFLWPLLDALPWIAVTAVDVLAHRVADLDAVRRGGVARLTAVRTDATRLAVGDGAFDAVTLLEVLEHLRAPEAAAEEAMRVARTAVVATVRSHQGERGERLHLLGHARLEAMFRAAGARRITVQDVLGHAVVIARR